MGYHYNLALLISLQVVDGVSVLFTLDLKLVRHKRSLLQRFSEVTDQLGMAILLLPKIRYFGLF